MENDQKVIAVFGGTFDPPHRGHLRLINRLTETDEIKSIYVVPTGQNPLKDKTATPYNVRLDMTETAVGYYKWNKPVTVLPDEPEPENPDDTVYSAIRTLDILHTKEPDEKFAFVIGADCLPDFNKWIEFQRIIDEYGLIVMTRTGYPLELPEYMQGHPNIIVIEDKDALNISSSQIRQLVKDGDYKKCVRLTLPVILSYIEKYSLYDIYVDIPPKYYKQPIYVGENDYEQYRGRIWSYDYLKLYTNLNAANAKNGEERLLAKMVKVPDFNLDFNSFLYNDAVICSNMDNAVEITEEEYRDAILKAVADMNSMVYNGKLISAPDNTDDLPVDGIPEDELLIRDMKSGKVEYPNGDFGYYSYDVPGDKDEPTWATIYVHPIYRFDYKGEPGYICQVFSIPNSTQTENRLFSFICAKFAYESEIKGFSKITQDEYLVKYRVFIGMFSTGPNTKGFYI